MFDKMGSSALPTRQKANWQVLTRFDQLPLAVVAMMLSWALNPNPALAECAPGFVDIFDGDGNAACASAAAVRTRALRNAQIRRQKQTVQRSKARIARQRLNRARVLAEFRKQRSEGLRDRRSNRQSAISGERSLRVEQERIRRTQLSAQVRRDTFLAQEVQSRIREANRSGRKVTQKIANNLRAQQAELENMRESISINIKRLGNEIKADLNRQQRNIEHRLNGLRQSRGRLSDSLEADREREQQRIRAQAGKERQDIRDGYIHQRQRVKALGDRLERRATTEQRVLKRRLEIESAGKTLQPVSRHSRPPPQYLRR